LPPKEVFYNGNSPAAFMTKYTLTEEGWSSPGMQGAESIFPTYVYPKSPQQSLLDEVVRTPNFKHGNCKSNCKIWV
jgi:hypothetical protein